MSIFSHAVQVQFGLVTDAALTRDPESLVCPFPEEFDEYLYSVLLHLPADAETIRRLARP